MSRLFLKLSIIPRNIAGSMLLIIASLMLSGGVVAETTSNPAFCVSCHVENPMHGVHAGTQFGPTNLVAACIDCHGEISDLKLHEINGADMIRYAIDTEANPKAVNDSCLACHKTDELMSGHWTHIAHGDRLACSSCHQLHTENDPVRGISNKSTIQLCVDCHTEQTLAGQGGKP